MKRIILSLGSFFIIGLAAAQSNYFIHTIKDGETLTKLAGKYGTTVGDIMRLNQMTTDSKLSVGEKVKIPKSGDSNTGSAVETTHTVAKGETLYSIARQNKVTVAQIRDWNNIPDNTIKDGQVLRLTPPDNGTTSDNSTASAPTATDESASNKATSVSGTVAVNSLDVSDNSGDNTKQRSSDATDVSATTTSASDNSAEGAFGVIYQSKANGTEMITKGSAGIFKSASGWQDKKYYVLMNDITPGTIVKVQANGKTVYAKVLWNLGNVKENQGLTYRISDAAASALNLSGNTFDVIVSYYK